MEPILPVHTVRNEQKMNPQPYERNSPALIGMAISVGATTLMITALPLSANSQSAVGNAQSLHLETPEFHSDEEGPVFRQPNIYRILSGDTPTSIGLKYGVPVPETDANELIIDQVLTLPNQDVVATSNTTTPDNQSLNQIMDSEDLSLSVQSAESNFINPPHKSPNHALREEISRLRNKYRSHKQEDAVNPAVASQENGLENKLNRLSESVEGNLEKLREKQRASSEVVAMAPLGYHNYETVIETHIVSPELPPLNQADKYLPNHQKMLSGYIWPTKGELTSGYGWRWGRMHAGIDIAAPIGTPIFAAASGVVTYAGWDEGGYGNLVEIQHSDGSITRYAHNHRILVKEGQTVEQGQQICEMGSTGYSTGPHLHFEIHLAGAGSQNPLAYLPAR